MKSDSCCIILSVSGIAAADIFFQKVQKNKTKQNPSQYVWKLEFKVAALI